MIFTLKQSIILFICITIFLTMEARAAIENLKITSDNLTVTKSKLSATFEGSVIVRFEDIKLTTSKLTIFYTDLTDKKEIKKIVIPVKLKAIKNCGKEVIIADKGEYENSKKKLTLEGNVKMLKEGNILATNKLIYSAQFKSLEQKK